MLVVTGESSPRPQADISGNREQGIPIGIFSILRHRLGSEATQPCCASGRRSSPPGQGVCYMGILIVYTTSARTGTCTRRIHTRSSQMLQQLMSAGAVYLCFWLFCSKPGNRNLWYLDVPCQSPAVFCSQYMLAIVIKHPHLHQTDATEGRTEKSPKHSWKMLIGYNLLQSQNRKPNE